MLRSRAPRSLRSPDPALSAPVAVKRRRQGCEEYEALAQAKASILDFVETRMVNMAPNVCAIIGSRITAQVLALTGGLANMSSTPSCNVQVGGHRHLFGDGCVWCEVCPLGV